MTHLIPHYLRHTEHKRIPKIIRKDHCPISNLDSLDARSAGCWHPIGLGSTKSWGYLQYPLREVLGQFGPKPPTGPRGGLSIIRGSDYVITVPFWFKDSNAVCGSVRVPDHRKESCGGAIPAPWTHRAIVRLATPERPQARPGCRANQRIRKLETGSLCSSGEGRPPGQDRQGIGRSSRAILAGCPSDNPATRLCTACDTNA